MAERISLEEFAGAAPKTSDQEKSNRISLEEFARGVKPQSPTDVGFFATIGEAAKKGFVSGIKETVHGLPGQGWQYTPETKEPTYLEKLLTQPISEGWTDPKWWAANMTYGMTKSSPTIGASVVGGGLGSITPMPGGMVIGAVGGGALGSYLQSVAPAYQNAREKGLSHDEAVDYAIKESGIATVFGGVSGGAPFLKVAKGPISQALAQIFGVQPGLSVAQEVATKKAVGEEVNLEDLLKTYAIGTGIGALQTGAGKATEAIGRRVRPEASPPTPSPPSKPDSPEVAAGKELGFLYAKAERDVNPNDLVFLDYAKRGGYGETIQKEALAFLDEQKQKVFEAAQRIEGEVGDTTTPGRTANVSAIPRDELMSVARRLQDDVRQAQEAATAAEQRLREIPERFAETIGEDIRGGTPRIETRTEAGEVIGPALRADYEARRAAEREAYRRAEREGGGFYLDAIQNLGTRIRERLSEPTLESSGMLLTDRDAPIANRALNYLDAVGRLRMQNIADPRNIVSGGDGQPVIFNLTGIEAVRRELNRLYGEAQSKANRSGDQTDFAAIKAVRNNFEQHLDDAFVNGMFSGNPQAIAAWTEARGMARDRKQLFLKSTEHPEGKIIREIVDRQPDPQAVGNMLFGLGRMGRGEMSVLLARRLGTILGVNSQSMSAIRQAVWGDVSSGARVRTRNGDVDPRLVARDVLEFVGDNDRNATDLARELYTPELRQRMREYANSIRGLNDAIANAPEVVRAGEVRARVEAALSPDIGGRAGAVFRRLVDGTATPEEVANLVATHYAHAPSPNLARMIAHIKTLTGPNSDSMSAIRQLLFKRLVLNADESGTKSPIEMSKGIREFLDGKGSSVARSAMRPSDMIEIRKFEQGLRPYILPEVAKTGSPTEIRQSGRRFQEGDIEAKKRMETVSRALGQVVLGKVPGMIREPLVTTIGKMAGERKKKSSVAKLETEYMQKLREQIEEGFAKAEVELRPVIGPRAALATKKEEDEPRRATGGSVLDNMAEARANGGSVNWTANNSLWQQLSPYQKAAAMALMEADRKDPEAAKNALGAMINRAARSNQDLGSHVSQRIYQPTIEATQQARLPSILKSEQFKDLAGWAERRVQGQEPDPVQGATHFLAPERTMLALEAQDPNKYKSWRSWTGFDPEAQAYRNVVLRDKSHAFLAPEGRYSAPYHGEGGEGYRQPTSQDQAALDRLVADASQRGAMDDLVQKTTQQPSSISEADKANLAKMIQGLQKQPEMAPLPPIQPVQLGSPTPITPVTPYDQPRAMGGGVLRKFKKKADGGSISSDGVYGDEDFKWPEQPKPQSGWDRDVVLPLARKVEDGQVVKGGGILGSDWHFATPQMALDALNTALHVGTSKISEPYRLDPEAREKMVEMAGSVIGPQAGVGIGRAAALGAEAGLGSHGGRLPMPKGGSSSLDPLGYYSQALEAAKSIPQAKGTPEQMLAQLKKAGAKDAEIAATGLDDYLSGKTIVTRDEIMKHLNENRVALNEVRSEANARTGDVQRATALEAQERLNAARDELIGLESGRMSNFMNRRRIETLRNDIIPELRREVQAADEASIATRRTQWENYSLDPNNPTYRETVLHLPESVDKLRDLRQSELNRIVDKYGHLSNAPETERAAFEDLSRRAYEQRPDRIDFQSGHFPEPNIIGHMMTSMTKHEGKPVYTIDQIQSDWGQKIRDRVPMSKEEMAKLQARRETLADALAKLPEERKGTRYEEGLSNQIRLLDAEIKTAEGKADGHPLVNTTDQWTNTTLRRALTQAVNEGADYIAIPSGDTVLSYNPGDKAGMRGFYGSSEGEGIVPKNLRKLLSKIDPDSAKSVQIDKLETPTRGLQGEGFTLFPITPKVREIIKEKGLPMFEGTIGAQPVNPYDEDRSVLARFKKDRRP